MNLKQFSESLAAERPPEGLSLQLQALWHDGKGNWQAAHELIQDESGADAALIHAYLHRKEGDSWNADYWYRRAGEKMPALSLAQEWESLVMRFTV